jgi:ribA/ribD-fused uncharacterized protein
MKILIFCFIKFFSIIGGIMNEVITFTKVRLPFGWLSNMAPFPIQYQNTVYLTNEALFQCLRFEDFPGDPKLKQQAKEAIRAQNSPMVVKWVSKRWFKDLGFHVNIGDEQDLERMRLCLKLKINQHSHLVSELLKTEDKLIIEDSSNQKGKTRNIWGATYENGVWDGQNEMGRLWMELRAQLRNEGN